MKRSTKIGIGVVAVLIVIVAAGYVAKGKDRNVPSVTVDKVNRTDLISKVTANGKIQAKRKVDLSANVMGQIINLAVREGDLVHRNDFLLQIDKAQLAASAAGAEQSVNALMQDREAARASAQEARSSYDRARRSFDNKLISQSELDKARAAVASAEASGSAIESRIQQGRAALMGARDTLSKTTIRSPMDGLVTRLPVEEGEVAVIGTMNNAGTVLMTISDMSEVEAVMEVDETDVPTVRVGQKASVTVDAYPNQTFSGVVTEVGSSPVTKTGVSGTEAVNFEVKIQLDHPPANIRPGFSVSAEINTGSRNGVVAIPIQALVVREKPSGKPQGKPAEEEGAYTFDRAANKVKFVPVKTGITGETAIEITSGLSPGAEIVTGPFKVLRDIKDGDKVKLEKPKGKDGDKKPQGS
ncbi:MAG TPA: efflux RND transporter periplasmic adaptor subunit [Thermoanaerobaculia bacterium]|nr:efflux RND transporter periplasmic adaptor subunit [Thermoanaerobaculia bacterium]